MHDHWTKHQSVQLLLFYSLIRSLHRCKKCGIYLASAENMRDHFALPHVFKSGDYSCEDTADKAECSSGVQRNVEKAKVADVQTPEPLNKRRHTQQVSNYKSFIERLYSMLHLSLSHSYIIYLQQRAYSHCRVCNLRMESHMLVQHEEAHRTPTDFRRVENCSFTHQVF